MYDVKRVRCQTCAMSNVCGVKRVRCQTCAVSNVCGVKRVRCQACAMSSVCGVKRVRCQTCAMSNVCGVCMWWICVFGIHGLHEFVSMHSSACIRQHAFARKRRATGDQSQLVGEVDLTPFIGSIPSMGSHATGGDRKEIGSRFYHASATNDIEGFQMT